MDWQYFFLGVGFLVAAYLIYRMNKGGPSSEKNGWMGPALPLYVQGWGVIIMCVMVGIAFILKSLPASI
ncbi:hypothetical protein IDJ77_21180 [Mucilaginibacter sp. ZT4R22]|uniref:Secreted protein with PEP-CTERM sorting signal n=1 Tax=Mucilaginibacter pankratovii TaxID=2772110 RepID=A0ABR7WVM4_9SPHI|nr:hypothetical protein [Mucilaginibacter pankratovii]